MLIPEKIFGDSMILQRHKVIKVFGQSAPLSDVHVSLNETSSKTTADENGNWLAELPPMEAATGLTMKIWNAETQIIYKDVCIGEVWIAGGQSNMEYWLNYDADKDSVLANERNPYIRFFDYPEISYEGQDKDFDYCHFGFWRHCTEEDLPWFSAAAYYFAANIQPELDVPVGIVGCNWGGTRACCWMDTELLKGTPGQVWLDEYEEGLARLDMDTYNNTFKQWADKTNPMKDPFTRAMLYPGMSREDQLEMMASPMAGGPPVDLGPYDPWRPGGLYKFMLKHIAPYSARGIIWYQGESDEIHATIYAFVLGEMIKCWRKLWNDDLPFLYVQLAPFEAWLESTGDNFPTLRSQQALLREQIDNTWMISIGDSGMRYDIHPKHKKPVGTRLALAARKHVYGEDIIADAPEFTSLEKNDHQIILHFANAEKLHCPDAQINALTVEDHSGNLLKIENFKTVDSTLILKGHFKSAVKISYAWQPYYEINLFNAAGLPAFPFKAPL